MTFKEKAKQIKAMVPVLFLSLKDKRTPLIAKTLALITLSYSLSPIDLIPDFIPVLGYLDDIILLPMLITLTLKCIPPDIVNDYKNKSCLLEKKWYYSISVIVIYAIILTVIIMKVVK